MTRSPRLVLALLLALAGCKTAADGGTVGTGADEDGGKHASHGVAGDGSGGDGQNSGGSHAGQAGMGGSEGASGNGAAGDDSDGGLPESDAAITGPVLTKTFQEGVDGYAGTKSVGISTYSGLGNPGEWN
ncbi:MAG TPA: hypothetical protein VHM19_19655, partial [Polyangiales bacterium]|nr:hypothetical protein [Polyangiales bacterium]